MNLGRLLPLSDTSLEGLAKITEADQLAARALFQSSVPKRYQGLLEAPLIHSTVTAETAYAWNPQTGRYIYRPTGRAVDPFEIRTRAIEPLILRSTQLQRSLSAQLQNREISLAQWQTQMIAQIKQTQVATALAANGGEKNTNDSDKEEIALLILALLLLFQGFSEDIAEQRQALNGLLLVRSDLYANAARGIYESVGGYVARVYLGKTEERRLLSPAEHCHTDHEFKGCVELADLGWRPIGSLPPIGQSPCRSNCKCRKIYR